MTTNCTQCGQSTSPDRRICRQCSLEDRFGVPSDYFDDDGEDDGRDDYERFLAGECHYCRQCESGFESATALLHHECSGASGRSGRPATTSEVGP